MHRYWDTVIEPLLAHANPRTVVEIGAATGLNTRHLIEFCRRRGAVLHVIDPAQRFDVAGWRRQYGDLLIVHETTSLTALPRIEPADAVLIDGDHNWYTVFHELRTLRELADREGRNLPLVLLHDVDWPYGRRDLYYNPDDIPAEYRKSFERAAIEPGCSGLQGSSGFNRHLYNATEEGGPRNGVATAVEDFLASCEPRPEFLHISGFHGLGVIVPIALMEQNEPLRSFLGSITPGPALARHIDALERARLAAEVRWEKLTKKGAMSAETLARKDQPIGINGQQREPAAL
jgi:hypothetical protein